MRDGLLLTGWLRPDGGAGVLCAAERESGAPRLLLPLRPLLQLAARTGHSLLAASRLCRRPPRHIAFLGSGPALLQSVSAFDALFEPNCINIFCGDRAGVGALPRPAPQPCGIPVYFSRTTKGGRRRRGSHHLRRRGAAPRPPGGVAGTRRHHRGLYAAQRPPPPAAGPARQMGAGLPGLRSPPAPCRARPLPAGEKTIRGDLAGLLSGALPGRETEEESILYTHDGAVGLALPLAAEICRAYFAQRQADRAKTSKTRLRKEEITMGFRVNAQDITTNYTQTLAEFTASLKYEDIPPEVLERAKHFTMQTIGVSLGAKGLPMTDKAIAIGKACGVGEPEATLWVDGSKVSMTSAVFANSTMADILDWEDCSWTGHPSAGVIPVAWAAAGGTPQVRKGVSHRRGGRL